MPTTTSAHARGAPSGVLVALLFLLLLTGVLGMHGWGSHGVASAGHMPSAHSGGLAGMKHPAVAMAVAVGETASSSMRLLDGGAPGGLSLAGLCVAVLSTVGLVLLLVWALRRWAALPLPSSRPWHARRVPGRDRDPPSLARLSVLRS